MSQQVAQVRYSVTTDTAYVISGPIKVREDVSGRRFLDALEEDGWQIIDSKDDSEREFTPHGMRINGELRLLLSMVREVTPLTQSRPLSGSAGITMNEVAENVRRLADEPPDPYNHADRADLA